MGAQVVFSSVLPVRGKGGRRRALIMHRVAALHGTGPSADSPNVFSLHPQLMLFCRREGKWDEVPYVDLFFTLQNDWKSRKECGLIAKDVNVLALEQVRNKMPKRCCSACSIGKRCKNYKEPEEEEEEEDVELLVAPGQRNIRGGNDQAGNEEAGEGDANSDAESEGENFSPIAGRTRRGGAAVLQAPLRQAVGPAGEPVGLKGFKRDIQVVLKTLSYEEQRTVVVKAREEAERVHAQAAQAGRLEDHFPSNNPNWDPNNQAQRLLLTEYQRLILFGVRNVIPKPKNLSKLYQVVQGKDETPSAAFERLCEVAKKWTDLDPEREADALTFVTLFVGQSNPDIRRKLQKIENKILLSLEPQGKGRKKHKRLQTLRQSQKKY
ncbi:hypothetical protein QYF61_000318 [Mycteria americana]|uniref:Core shell protein Gag P30 domain-containing protein n=1 Tax=Mycteria americana TaxID=33587 RepID=A0AAN7RHH3_MYCAM|nr:hypothetical protein QYF61_000318 [Mycteria americana]